MSDYAGVEFVFDDDRYEKHTVDRDGEVRAIVVWFEYEPRHYAIFFLLSEDANGADMKELKKLLDDATVMLSPLSCTTYSRDDEKNNRMHEFFGLRREGEVVVEGKTLNKWVIRWD